MEFVEMCFVYLRFGLVVEVMILWNDRFIGSSSYSNYVEYLILLNFVNSFLIIVWSWNIVEKGVYFMVVYNFLIKVYTIIINEGWIL